MITMSLYEDYTRSAENVSIYLFQLEIYCKIFLDEINIYNTTFTCK